MSAKFGGDSLYSGDLLRFFGEGFWFRYDYFRLYFFFWAAEEMDIFL